MKCPSCEQNIELTWPQYLKFTFISKKCPKCFEKFKIKRSLMWHVWNAISFVILVSILIGHIQLALYAIEHNNISIYWVKISIIIITISYIFIQLYINKIIWHKYKIINAKNT